MKNQALLRDSQRNILVQGITGSEAQYWTKQMLDYGSNVVAGVTPKKAGQEVHGRPVFDSVADARAAQGPGGTEGPHGQPAGLPQEDPGHPR